MGRISVETRGKSSISGRPSSHICHPLIGGVYASQDPIPEDFSKKASGRTQMLDPETAASYLTALDSHGQPGIIVETSVDTARCRHSNKECMSALACAGEA